MNGQPPRNKFNDIIQKQRQIIKKLEEIRVKLEDLKTAKSELISLVEGVEQEILRV